MVYFISDTHFCSENIIKYCNRPFKDAEEMNEQLIQRWNAVVKPEDKVFHLGDVVMHQSENIPSIIPRLNGEIHLITGNHDTRAKLEVLKKMPNIVAVDFASFARYKNLFLVLNHFPMTDPEFLDMVNTENSEVFCVHGHVHDKQPFFVGEKHAFNVSADVVDFTPVPITRIYSTARNYLIEKGVWQK